MNEKCFDIRCQNDASWVNFFSSFRDTEPFERWTRVWCHEHVEERGRDRGDRLYDYSLLILDIPCGSVLHLEFECCVWPVLAGLRALWAAKESP